MAYEAEGIFIDIFTQEELETMLAAAKKTFLEEGGEQIVSWSSSGSSSSTRFAYTADQMLAECRLALSHLDPVTYPPAKDRTVARIR